MRSKIAIALVIAAVLSMGARNGEDQTDKATSVAYEYQVIGDPIGWQGHDEGLKKLNQLGAQGWEITGVVQHGENPPTLYLKRVRRSL
jgi:hypothetical protein